MAGGPLTPKELAVPPKTVARPAQQLRSGRQPVFNFGHFLFQMVKPLFEDFLFIATDGDLLEFSQALIYFFPADGGIPAQSR